MHTTPALILMPLMAVLLPAVLFAQDQVLEVRTADHQRLQGQLVSFSLDQGLLMRAEGQQESISIPAQDLVSLARPAAPMHESPPFRFMLGDGNRLVGWVVDRRVDQIVVDTVMRKGIALPLDQLRACLAPRADQYPWKNRIARLMREGPSLAEDHLLLSNGDTLRGFLVSMASDTLFFEGEHGETGIDVEHLVAVVLAGERATASADRLSARIQFRDDSRITVSRIRWTPDILDMTCFDGSAQDWNAAAVSGVEVVGGRWVWLNELTPVASVHIPAMSLYRPFRRDQNVHGGPLVVAGQAYVHGIGVQSRSILTYALDGGYHEFSACAGLDDTAGPLADVDVEVVVDGKIRWEKKSVKARQPCQEIRIDIEHAKMLELRVDYGANGDVQDRFDWADAALIR